MQHRVPGPTSLSNESDLLLTWQPGPRGVWTVSEAAADCACTAGRVTLRLPRRLLLNTSPRTLQGLLNRPLPLSGPALIAAELLAAARGAGEAVQDDPALASAIAALVDQALAAEGERCGLSSTRAAGDGDAQRHQMQAYLLARVCDRALSMDRVAEAFGMSRRSLYKLFETWGTTPRAFVHNAKLDRACQLLREAAAAPVARIAAECGFSDPAHFSRAFQARHGAAPTAWRAMQT